jgi:hypothetical protein
VQQQGSQVPQPLVAPSLLLPLLLRFMLLLLVLLS